MTTYRLVMPEDMNHYGFLFGGKMLMWIDEIAWIAVSNDYPSWRCAREANHELGDSARGGTLRLRRTSMRARCRVRRRSCRPRCRQAFRSIMS